MSDTLRSGDSANDTSRFTSQAHTVEDRLKADTVGLVQLSDFRKRRVEALEAAQDSNSAASSPEPREVTAKVAVKKRKKIPRKGGLSFGDEEDDASGNQDGQTLDDSSDLRTAKSGVKTIDDSSSTNAVTKRAFKPNAAVSLQPKAMTKSTVLKDTQMKDALKKEYVQLQEAVKATEFVLPFVFYNGKNRPGGMCRMKKGDPVWLFLDRARKVGAGLAGQGGRSTTDWARTSVDDLMIVQSDIIIPHHYDFHYFIVNQAFGYQGPLFAYSNGPTATTPEHLIPGSVTPAPSEEPQGGLLTAAERAARAQRAASTTVKPADSELEGFKDDPSLTKVVDRRWYERHKHVFPASSWEEFDASKDYRTAIRKDGEGNARFFSG